MIEINLWEFGFYVMKTHTLFESGCTHIVTLHTHTHTQSHSRTHER